MPITSDSIPSTGYVEKTGLTAGNEYVFTVPANMRILVTAKGATSADAANLIFAMDYRGKIITDTSTFDQQYAADQTGNMAVYAGPGLNHVALRITSGTWRMRINIISTNGV